MNRPNINSSEIGKSSIDRMLATEEPLLPSSGFLSSVMGRVRDEATAPPQIPFPWKRVFPGVALIACLFGWGVFEFVRNGLPSAGTVSLVLPHLSAAGVQSLEQASWVAGALGVSLLSWLLSRRLAGRTGLL
jgi:hypothetical protein